MEQAHAGASGNAKRLEDLGGKQMEKQENEKELTKSKSKSKNQS
jgi:hypothetical protein